MQKRKIVALIVAAVSAIALSALRVVAMPLIVEGQGGVLNTVLFVLTLVASVAFVLLGGKERSAGVVKEGLSLRSIGAVFAGMAMLISSFFVFVNWKFADKWPYPVSPNQTNLDVAFLYGLMLFGVLGGLFLVAQGFRWYRGNRGSKGVLAFASLAPLVWVWMRICRYEVSYFSSLKVFRHWYDLLLLIFEMLFFLALSRFVTRTGGGRFLFGLSLSTGVLAVMACVTRAAMVLLGEREAFDSCGLLTAADLGVAVLAFGVALSHRPAVDGEEEEEESDEEAPKEDGEEDDYLLLDMPASLSDEEDEAADADEPRRPIELEDMIRSMMEGLSNEEK